MPLIDYSSAEGDAYHRSVHHRFLGTPGLGDAWAAVFHRTHFPHLRPGATVLEIGAGLGTNLLHLRLVAKVYAVEPAPVARMQCAAAGLFVVAQISDLPVDLCFDHVILCHVLEHVAEPRAMLQTIRPRLSPTGCLLVVVPGESPWAMPDPEDVNHHLYGWNGQTLTNLLIDAGYRVRSVRVDWYSGRRLFLPLYRWGGPWMYAWALRILGWFRREGEIVVQAEAG